MIRSLNEFVSYAKNLGRRKVAVAAAHDDNVLQSIDQAHNEGLIDAILIGDKEKLINLSDKLGIDISKFDVVKEADDTKAARIAVDMVVSGEAQLLMKGHMMTGDLLRVVLDKNLGLRTNRILSHIGIVESENYHKLLFVTDAGINIEPDIKHKADIIQNAVDVAVALGVEKPKVAVLAAIEQVNPSMQATLDAAALCKMVDRGQIHNCIIDGPLALDNAINKEASIHKGIHSEVAGEADILVVPDIEAGNILLKSIIFMGKAKSCAIINGAKVPLIVTSRAEDYTAKLNSIALASIISSKAAGYGNL